MSEGRRFGYDTRFGSGWISGVASVVLGLMGVGAVPRFHHWHHAVRPADKNFAIHLPVIDRLFETHYLPPGRWPEAYGIEGDPVPARYPGQVLHPFRHRPP
jgi:sterol desaturase/sphingolipid hydroxylase (fatty acid hydroxylase superfamily)